jgi:hypothetical protein
MTHSDDNLVFDRLADGELSAVERQELLSSLDSRPDGWRRCALALLEAQTWRSEFKSFATEKVPPSVVRANILSGNRETAPTSLPARPSGALSGKWLALAASALVAFGLGWSMRSPQATIVPSKQLANTIPAQKPQNLDSRDAVTLLVKDDSGQHQRLRLPLVDAEGLDQQLTELSPSIPAELRAGLQDRGYDLQSRRRFAPLFFEQDKQLVPMVVPVNDTYIVPVNRPVY